MEELKWQEIKDEALRIYQFPGGEKVEIFQVARICVRPSGTHRLETQKGQKFIVPAGWLAIEITADAWSF